MSTELSSTLRLVHDSEHCTSDRDVYYCVPVCKGSEPLHSAWKTCIALANVQNAQLYEFWVVTLTLPMHVPRLPSHHSRFGSSLI
jgi:hypothetical protein